MFLGVLRICAIQKKEFDGETVARLGRLGQRAVTLFVFVVDVGGEGGVVFV